MRFVTGNEIEYLNSISGSEENPDVVREMSERLDALRRFDQDISEADWRPSASRLDWIPPRRRSQRP